MYMLIFGIRNNALEVVFRKFNHRHSCNIFQVRWQSLTDKTKNIVELHSMGSIWLSSLYTVWISVRLTSESVI